MCCNHYKLELYRRIMLRNMMTDLLLNSVDADQTMPLGTV